MQLADVSGPVVGPNPRQSGLVEAAQRAIEVAREALEEVVGQSDQIFGPLPERGQVDPDDVQAEEQIFPEAARSAILSSSF